MRAFRKNYCRFVAQNYSLRVDHIKKLTSHDGLERGFYMYEQPMLKKKTYRGGTSGLQMENPTLRGRYHPIGSIHTHPIKKSERTRFLHLPSWGDIDDDMRKDVQFGCVVSVRYQHKGSTHLFCYPVTVGIKRLANRVDGYAKPEIGTIDYSKYRTDVADRHLGDVEKQMIAKGACKIRW